MTKLLPKELVQAKELKDRAKFKEALEIITNFENIGSNSPEDLLSALLIKANIYDHTQQFEECVNISEKAYQISQDLGLISESIEALIWKSDIAFMGDLDKGDAYLKEAEMRLKSLTDDSDKGTVPIWILLINKSWIKWLKGNIKESAELAGDALKLIKEQKFGTNLELALIYQLLGHTSRAQGNLPKALNHALKSLEFNKELNHKVAIAGNYFLIAGIHRREGDYDKALQYCKQSLAIEEITNSDRLGVLGILSDVCYMKNEFKRALRYRKRAFLLAEELNLPFQTIWNLIILGYYYRGSKFNLAVKYWEQSLMLSEKWGFIIFMAQSLMHLTCAYIETNSRGIADRYFSRLSELYNRTKDKGDTDIYLWYLFSKACMMKTSTRMRDRVEAQAIYKKLIDITEDDLLILSLGNLCDLLLEELSIYNDPEILGEIIPVITRCIDIVEERHNYVWLANIKLLQAKLSLIQMDLSKARRLMGEAQRIADLHGLNLLAWGISSEHDKLLEQIDVWDKIKKEEAPIAERIQLASTNRVLERIQGKPVMDFPESVEEQSTVLLIIAEGGVLVFSYPFSKEWKVDEDLFSSFLSAFTSFSTEAFSKGLDRVKFGDDMMLMESIGPFSFCYLFKGQTYLARQKLSKFTEELQKDEILWQNLEQYFNTSQILEINDVPLMKNLITEIFQK